MSASPGCLLLAATLCSPGALGATANQRYDSPLREHRTVAATGVAAPQTLSPTQPAKGRFLVASHSLADPNFSETVVLLLSYEPTGAMGVIINRPAGVRLGSLLRDVEELRDRPDPVYLGGPIARNLLLVLIRAARRPESSETILKGVYASGSRTALRKALGNAGKRNRVRGYAGHAGWGPGQLDREIARGDWHVAAADAATVFDLTASAIWPELIQRFSGEWTRREAPTEPDGLEDFSLRPAGLSIFSEVRRLPMTAPYGTAEAGAGETCGSRRSSRRIHGGSRSASGKSQEWIEFNLPSLSRPVPTQSGGLGRGPERVTGGAVRRRGWQART